MDRLGGGGCGEEIRVSCQSIALSRQFEEAIDFTIC